MWNEVSEIYKKMGDEESKFIFRKRLEYNLCKNDTEPLREIIRDYKDEENQTVLSLIQNKEKHKNNEIVLFGAGRWGIFYYNMLKKYNIGSIVAFCDNNKKGTMCMGLEVLSAEDAYKKFPKAIFVITVSQDRMQMKKQLLSLGVKEENIFIYLYTSKVFGMQYFDENIIKKSKLGGVFIDGGSLDLWDTRHFIERNKDFEKIYAFEPSRKNYGECLKVKSKFLNNDERIEIVNKGLWSDARTLSFAENDGSSCLYDKGAEVVEVVSLDQYMQGREKVSFIKMDIEGAEMEALKGAKKTIIEDSPNLAICIYHKDEDILEIPNYILELNPNYTLYIRHYSCYVWETVLYAVIE